MPATEASEERQVVCSRCLQVVLESVVHVIPCFNSDVGQYVTSYRCERCWLPSLEETSARMETTADEAEITSVATFFERHGVILLEFRRGDPMPVVRAILLQMIDRLRSGAIRLSIGLERQSEMPLTRLL